MHNNENYVRKIVGLIIILIGAWGLRTFPGIFLIIKNFPSTLESFGLTITILFIFLPILQPCILAGGVGFILKKKWSVPLLCFVLLVDIIVISFSIGNYWVNWFLLDEKYILPKDPNVHIMTISMIPLYIKFIFEITALTFVARLRNKR
ncbi:MAG: hypothetical protein GY707_00860 [Desulfobacteraceae bacterium]|nr:hypothetical protein [Desulfobacteraceae bacterium]